MADLLDQLVQLAGGIRRPGRPHHRHPLGAKVHHGVLPEVVVILHHIDGAAHLLEGHLPRPHATTPDTRRQHQGSGQPNLDPRFHMLSPSAPSRHSCDSRAIELEPEDNGAL
ncbi:hypothetical protein D3C76_1256980 [compost metagenome]